MILLPRDRAAQERAAFRGLLAVAAREPGRDESDDGSGSDDSDADAGDDRAPADGGDGGGGAQPEHVAAGDGPLSREMYCVLHRLYACILRKTFSLGEVDLILDIFHNNGWGQPLSAAGQQQLPHTGAHVMRIVRRAFIQSFPLALQARGSNLKVYFRDTPDLSRKMLMCAAWCESIKTPEQLLRAMPQLCIWGALFRGQYAFVRCGPTMHEELAPVVPGVILRDDVADGMLLRTPIRAPTT